MIPAHRIVNEDCRPPVEYTVGGTRTADQKIVDQACQALRTSGYTQLRHLQVSFEHGRMTLQGQLPTYYLKQVAQSVIQDVAGVREIDNDVKVLTSR